jgi:hypothetical protein
MRLKHHAIARRAGRSRGFDGRRLLARRRPAALVRKRSRTDSMNCSTTGDDSEARQTMQTGSDAPGSSIGTITIPGVSANDIRLPRPM